ncbi:hypothetical protein [Actinacidiphila yanglinensis]|uniref:hypothetical protein n=1 Tax=Actinacidiphila yanglinensis TaxID=310779 RepID=UPI000CDE66AD|nr:hypothetical protein [Actinacidiphila yanglinensis]
MPAGRAAQPFAARDVAQAAVEFLLDPGCGHVEVGQDSGGGEAWVEGECEQQDLGAHLYLFLLNGHLRGPLHGLFGSAVADGAQPTARVRVLAGREEALAGGADVLAGDAGADALAP